MPTPAQAFDAAETLAKYVGGLVALAGGGIAVFNSVKKVRWKRAELANEYLKEFTTNPELVFACRALDWGGGRLVVPEPLRPLLPESASWIIHAADVVRQAMRADLSIVELEADPRLQLYRTAVDSLLSWLALVESALDRNLFEAEDVRDFGFWVFLIHDSRFLDGFLRSFGYHEQIVALATKFRNIGVTAPAMYGGRDRSPGR